MPARRYDVRFEVAADERFRKVVRRGSAEARPGLGHSVHVEVGGLGPGREYFYRFKAGGEVSAVGRTKTAPAFDARPASVGFAFVSCQDWRDGFYAAYGHLAQEDLDFVVHLGDYIYEGGQPALQILRRLLPWLCEVRRHPGDLADDLQGRRDRAAQRQRR